MVILSMEGAWAPWALVLATKAFSRAAGGILLDLESFAVAPRGC